MLLLLLLLAVTNHFSSARMSEAARVRASAGANEATRAEIYETERANAARWARRLIWGGAGLWAVTVAALVIPINLSYFIPINTSYARTFQDNSSSYLSNLLLVIAFLVATLVVFYLVVHQRELVEGRADASGFDAVSRFDRREAVLGPAASGRAGTPRMEARPA